MRRNTAGAVCVPTGHGVVRVAPTSTSSATGTRARVARVRAEYPSQLDYSGFWMAAAASLKSHECAATWNLAYCQGALQNDGVVCLMPRAYNNGSQYKTK